MTRCALIKLTSLVVCASADGAGSAGDLPATAPATGPRGGPGTLVQMHAPPVKPPPFPAAVEPRVASPCAAAGAGPQSYTRHRLRRQRCITMSTCEAELAAAASDQSQTSEDSGDEGSTAIPPPPTAKADEAAMCPSSCPAAARVHRAHMRAIQGRQERLVANATGTWRVPWGRQGTLQGASCHQDLRGPSPLRRMTATCPRWMAAARVTTTGSARVPDRQHRRRDLSHRRRIQGRRVTHAPRASHHGRGPRASLHGRAPRLIAHAHARRPRTARTLGPLAPTGRSHPPRAARNPGPLAPGTARTPLDRSRPGRSHP